VRDRIVQTSLVPYVLFELVEVFFDVLYELGDVLFDVVDVLHDVLFDLVAVVVVVAAADDPNCEYSSSHRASDSGGNTCFRIATSAGDGTFEWTPRAGTKLLETASAPRSSPVYDLAGERPATSRAGAGGCSAVTCRTPR
jgi:hypothetical protein